MSKQAEELRYAVRFPVVLKYFGQLCIVVAVLTLVPFGVSALAGDFRISFRYVVVLIVLAFPAALFGRLRVSRRIRAPGSRRNLGGESPPPGDARSR